MAKTLKTILTIDMARFRGGLNNAKAAVKGFNTAIVKPLGDMIRKFVRLGVVVGAVGVAIAGFGLKAAGDIQNARMRLAGISNSAEDFRQSWAATYQTFVTSPLELGETIGAFTTLKNAGVGNKKMLDSVAGASVALGRSVQDVSLAFLSMETEPLRRMGVTARSVRKGMETAFTLEAMDKLGNKVTKTADNVRDARIALGELLDMKYGGTLDAFSRTLQGVLSTSRGIRQFAFFKLFESSIFKLSPLIMMFNARLQELAESGALEKFGGKIAEFAKNAIIRIHNFVQAIRNFSLKQWAADNMVNLIGFGTIFAVVFGVKIVGAVAAAIKALQLMPTALGGVLGVASAMLIGWNIGKYFEKQFDISHYVAKFMLGVKAMALSISDLVTGKHNETRWATYDEEIKLLEKAKKEASKKLLEEPDWMKEAFAKFKPITEEELASLVNAGGAIGDAIDDAADNAKKGWRDMIDERSSRGIGKIFGGGALGGGDERTRTKAALDMVKRQGRSNELLQQVVNGFNINNQRAGALAF